MSGTVFAKIIRREAPADIVYEDDLCIAFRDVAPKAPVHVLVCPKKPLPRLADAEAGDRELLGHLMLTAHKVAEMEGVGEAYRVAVNSGAGAGQVVFHLHLHVLGGPGMRWP